MYEKYSCLVDKHREEIFAVEQHIWDHPESGYKEWKTHGYLKDIFEKAGYALVEYGNIPGFYTDIDTGRPGPKILIMGELDALTNPDHPAAVDGCAHACGHHAQCAALVGIALALKEPGALDGLSGSIRLMATPAEELIEIEYRNSLRQQGVIKYLGGKVELLYRGYMDDVDICYLFHTRPDGKYTFDYSGCNGCVAKEIVYEGKAAHAGGAPHKAVNALYAAQQGMSAINALRETFQDKDHVRVHPVLNVGDVAVNIIPPKAYVSTYVRGASIEAMVDANKKVDRALASGALALGAKVHVTDQPGYAPMINYGPLMDLAVKALGDLVGPEQVGQVDWDCSSTDVGDLCCVIRSIQPWVNGATGALHTDAFCIADHEMACVTSAKGQLALLAALLENDAAGAREVLAGPEPLFPSKEAYFAFLDQFSKNRELVEYTADGARVAFG